MKILRGKETKWRLSSLRQCPVNLCGSRTYNVMTRLASCSLIAAFLLVAGCHHHYDDDDDGWRDGDREHRHHHRYDREDDRRYRDRDYR